MNIAPLPGPHGLYSVSVMPRFLFDSRNVGWQGAYFTDIDGAPEGTVDHGHTRYCIQRSLHHEERRTLGARDWHGFVAGVSVWRAGDEQRFDWRRGGRSQFLFVEPEVAESVIGHARALPQVGQRQPARSRMLEMLFDALQTDLVQGSPAGALVGDSLIAALLAQLDGMPAPRLLKSAPQVCRRAIDLIEARFAEPLGLQTLSEAAGVGSRQLCRAFQAAIGMSPHQYLLRCRTEEAKRLITRGMALADVALHCGFADQSQLTRTFVRHVGTTPGRYRVRTTR